MPSYNILILACLAYVAALFAVAFAAERLARRGQARWLRGPWVYTLSLSIYCTAWTFYGAVGYAARSGLEFVTIYLGPTLVMVGWWALLRKLVAVGRAQRITSIADLISARYGKSTLLGGLVTALAVVGTTPYIALQLQSVTTSFAVFAPEGGADLSAISFLVAAGLATFAIVFGTRALDLNERHEGVVTAIAVEAVVKLVALLAVGVFVVFWVAGGPEATFRAIEASDLATWEMAPGRWIGLTFLSAAAFLCLPRMFQVLVVENRDEGHLATASWAFPLYLFAMSLFVVPIAAVGLSLPGAGENPDLFVLTVPLSEGQGALAMLAFLGGFSSATSMVIVAAIALATMVSNHLVMPVWLARHPPGATVSGDVRDVVLAARRLSIAAVLALGYVYYRLSGGGAALAAIGLISFVGVAQVLPALLGGLYWRGATRLGAATGLGLGFAVWAWTMFLPSVGAGAVIPPAVLSEGPWGLGWLRPRALFGIDGLDPVLHALFWSLALNTVAFLAGSLLSFPRPIERLQGAAIVNVFRNMPGAGGRLPGPVEAEDLLMMAQRIIGPREAQAVFETEARAQGLSGYLPEIRPDFVARLERELAGSVGAATAHAMLSQLTGGGAVSVEELMRVGEETQQIMEYSARLEAQSSELTRTAAKLGEANAKLTQLSRQKDAFLSQISHELRTPMTSIRAFSEILRDGEGLAEAERARFVAIIHGESVRLTRLLGDLLDLGVLESGQVSLSPEPVRVAEVVAQARDAADPTRRLDMVIEGETDLVIETDRGRLVQVVINLVSNAVKYCDAERPRLTARIGARPRPTLDIVDNGSGIPSEARAVIFEKFARLGDSTAAGGAGLGLAICREIMQRLGGGIHYLPGEAGAAFRLDLPGPGALARVRAAE